MLKCNFMCVNEFRADPVKLRDTLSLGVNGSFQEYLHFVSGVLHQSYRVAFLVRFKCEPHVTIGAEAEVCQVS